jgi:tetratricopeptide (TPR) repeat protein
VKIRCVFHFALVAACACATHAPLRVHAQETELAGLREAARAAPQDAAAQRALGRGLIEAGRLDEADGQMAKLVRLEKSSLESLYEAMRVKFARDEYRPDRAGCLELSTKEPTHVLSHVCMARAFLVWRRASRAEEHVSAALAAEPTNEEALLVDAETKRMQGKHDAAIAAYNAVLARYPKNADAALGIAKSHLVRNDTAQAVAALRKAQALGPNDPDVLLELGRQLEGNEAVSVLERALAARPSSMDSKLALAFAQVRAGQAAKGEPTLRAIVAKDPKNVPARTQLGTALVALGKLEEAEKHLRSSLEKMPNDYDASFALAQLLERSGRSEEAFTQYRNASDLKRETTVPLIAAARMGISLGRPLLATALLDKALDRAPKSAEALALYGDALKARGDAKVAREYYQKALAGEGPLDRAHVQKQLAELK